MSKSYFIELLNLLLNRNFKAVINNTKTYTPSGLIELKKRKAELLDHFYNCLDTLQYDKALEIIKVIIDIEKEVSPDNNKQIDNYIKYRILLTEIVNLQLGKQSTAREYCLDECELKGNTIFNRYLEEHDFKMALFAVNYTYYNSECIEDFNRLLNVIDELNKTYKKTRIKKEEN